jgi:hypothetical protein
VVENSLERLKRFEYTIKKKLHEMVVVEVNGTSLGSCPVAGFGISSVEPRSLATRESVVYF